MIKNLIETFVQELSKDENKIQINNILMPYINNIKNDLKNEFIFYVYLLFILLVLILLTNIFIIYNHRNVSFW